MQQLAVEVGHRQALGEALDNRLQLGLALAQCRIGPGALGDVAQNHGEQFFARHLDLGDGCFDGKLFTVGAHATECAQRSH